MEKEISPILEFKNVRFPVYKKDREVLKKVSFKLEPGEKVSYYWKKNGSGKSTILELLLRCYEPEEIYVMVKI